MQPPAQRCRSSICEKWQSWRCLHSMNLLGMLPTALLLLFACAPKSVLAIVTGVAEINPKGTFVQQKEGSHLQKANVKGKGKNQGEDIHLRFIKGTRKGQVANPDESSGGEPSEPYKKLRLEQFGKDDTTCSGTPTEKYVFTPREAAPPNFVEGDTCIKIQNDAGTDKGHVEMSCQGGSEIHINEFLGTPEDESCGIDAPRSLHIQSGAMANVTDGKCVLASDQNDTEIYLKFKDIDEKVTWPVCEPEDLAETKTGMILFIIIGVVVLIVLVGIGGFAIHHMNQKPQSRGYGSYGEYGGKGAGYGEYGGKGGGYGESEAQGGGW